MKRFSLLLLLVAVAGCATDEDAAGTSNPGVMTPAEAPPDLGGTPADPPVDTTEAR